MELASYAETSLVIADNATVLLVRPATQVIISSLITTHVRLAHKSTVALSVTTLSFALLASTELTSLQEVTASFVPIYRAVISVQHLRPVLIAQVDTILRVVPASNAAI
jgi:hypothetical protein